MHDELDAREPSLIAPRSKVWAPVTGVFSKTPHPPLSKPLLDERLRPRFFGRLEM